MLDGLSLKITKPQRQYMSSRLCTLRKKNDYFFLPFAGTFLAAGLDLAAVVFLAAAGFFPFGDDGAADFFVAFLGAGFFAIVAFIIPLGRGSVLRVVEAGMGDAIGAVTGATGCCLAASCQFGKNNSMRWREMELARRQRGQCAS
jgi:hypothetical protein